jgi:hypothetical protein
MEVMSERSSETTITFSHPFMLKEFERPQPEGTYRLLIEESEILGLSFLAFRRSGTTLCVPALGVTGGRRETYEVDPAELAAALEADQRL